MATAQEVLNIAIKEIGYKEGKNNDNKYGKEYGLNNQFYCVQFIWYIFKHANASDIFYDGEKVASCTLVKKWAEKNGLVVKTPKSGDLVIFDWQGDGVTDHIGFIEKVVGSKLYTIEANTGNGKNQSDGDGVYRRIRDKSTAICYVRPKYGVSTNPKINWVEPDVYFPVLTKGSPLNVYVSILQTMLNYYNCNCGEVDGSFGSNTLNAVKAFQKNTGIVVDGSVGKITWSKLFNKI